MKFWKALVFVWKYAWGMALCQSFLGSVAVVGWTYRLAQREALKRWWTASGFGERGIGFTDFVGSSECLRGHRHWPNWFFAQNAPEVVRSAASLRVAKRVRRWLRATFHSLWLNLKVGVQGMFNTWVFTLPACLLWWFAWYAGWQNSFNKGYEHAAVGPGVGAFGVLLFIAAMFYVPLAQARQAATGQWRTFYDWPLVRDLIKRRWLACLGLAVLYAALTLPVMILKTAPAFFDRGPRFATLTKLEMLKLLSTYFFWACLFVFPAYVVLRVVAARIYAGALLDAVQSGALDAEDLAPIEREALQRLNLLRLRSESTPPVFLKVLARAGTRAGRITAGVLTFFVWFVFVAQIYVSEFLNYHARVGWLNQPTVQLPWFNYTPTQLKEQNQPR
jgi:hypothetical protein